MRVPYSPAPLEGTQWSAVLARPDDLSARAVLGDVLSEQGDPRGEYLQLALKDALTVDEAERRDALFDRCSPEWLRPLRPDDARLARNVRSLSFANGLVEQATILLRDSAVLDFLAERTPIRELEVLDTEADPTWVEWLPRHRIVPALRTFSFSGADQSAAERLMKHETFGGVETLSLSGALTASLTRAIAEHAPRVTSLSFAHRGDVVIEADAIAPLATLPLTELRIEGAALSSAAVKALAALPHLERLSLRRLPGDVAHELLPVMPRLTALSFDDGAIPVSTLAKLLGAASSLTDLTLDGAGLGSASVSQALGALPSSRLTSLSLNSNPLGDDGARALTTLGTLSALTDVSLSQCGITPEGFVALSAARWPLRRADFGLNTLDVDGCRALAHGPLCASLEELSLLMVTVGSRGAKALSTAPWLEHLRSLTLFGNRIGTTGLRALLEHLPSVRVLMLGRENQFKDEGLSCAAEGLLPRLREISVDEVTAKAIEAFVDSGHADDLRTAAFRNGALSEAAAKALVTLPRLRSLKATWSKIDPRASDLLSHRWPDFSA
ncbi:MAG: hypothetical protein Q8L14_13280 [Myxococcales bacterium]|nr:hypothetical protein [Myxococcales bacterium]